MLKSKVVKIGDLDVTIIQFSAYDAVTLRKELVSVFKQNLPSSDKLGAKEIIHFAAGLIYEIPVALQLELFKNCSAIGIGQISDKNAYNKVFENNLDGTVALALEVLELNGFFTLSTISIISQKIPMLAPMEAALKDALTNLKSS